MKFILTTICGVAAIALSSCATTKSKDKDAPTGPPSATLRFESTSAAYWASVGGGKGTLTYNGKSYPFSAKAVGAGGTGAQKISGIGRVYNLTQLADFPGTYTGPRSGFTLLQGTQHAKLTNQKGVVIYVEAQTSGLASSFGAATILIELR